MLVGRESERRAVGSLLAAARAGESRVLVLRGEPGIGKTALLDEAARHAEGMRVLRAQGVESEQFVPFSGLHQLLRPVLGVLHEIPTAQARHLEAALLLGPGPGTQAPPSRFAVGAATLSLLCRAAEDAPLAVLVDDAHLLDAPSAEALVFAARRLVADPVAVLVGVRTGEGGAAAWAGLPELVVVGLDLAATAALLARAAGAALRDDRVERLHLATAGNPLALLELGARGTAADAPAGAPVAVSEQLSRAFLGRVGELTPATRTGLLVAAADGASLAVVLEACAALGVPDPGLGQAEDVGLITVTGDRVTFRHPLVRSAVYGSAGPAARRAVHRAVAAVLPRSETDRLAWHLSESAVAPDEDTAATLDRVAAQASARGAYALAASTHERAAELTAEPTRRVGRLAAAGEAAWLAGLTARSVALLDRALAADPPPLLRARIQERRGAVETRCGSLDQALVTFVEAAEAVRGTDPDAAVRLFADAVHVAFYLGAPAAAMRASEAIDALADVTTDADARALGLIATGMAMVIAGAGEAGVARLRAAAYALVAPDGGVQRGDRFRLPLRIQGALWLRDAGDLRDVVGETIDRLREQSALGSLPYLLMHLARDAATTDRWDDAEAAYLEAVRLAHEAGHTTELTVALAGLACLHARRGESTDCLRAVTAALGLARRHHIRLASFWATFAQGDLAAGAGRVEDAARHYEQLLGQLTERGLGDPDQSCAPELVETYVHLARTDEAGALAERFAAAADAKGQPWSRARAQRALGLAAADGEVHFRSALELHARTADRYEGARTELAFGAWLRRARRRTEARPLLRSALATFESLGATPWADVAAHELGATGETATRRPALAADRLTPQERQIAAMLASGRTTRETAAALFLSPKTVEYHLRHVYQKLGVRSRAELAGALAGTHGGALPDGADAAGAGAPGAGPGGRPPSAARGRRPPLSPRR
ncbi:AAA family ATPase [Actinotalea solisilvae]|uniref:AAA family ATPase n=1 Tax=Actinotalea solisilvae TaxID=2072922 RepID=UPI0018F264FE|nr:AAA family ATPase [Actinotalea solisilvae]